MSADPKLMRVLSDLRHGGHAVDEALFKADPLAEATENVSSLESVLGCAPPADVTTISTPFGYMFIDLADVYPAAHLSVEPPSAVVTALKALGTAMVEPDPRDPGSNSVIPPVYTYLGQFIDHDLTANTDREDDIGILDADLTPLRPDRVLGALRNLRQPALNLDSLYGNGPDAPDEPAEVPYDGIRFRLGTITALPPAVGAVVPGDDLPRVGAGQPNPRKARIGDGRNDENLIVAQLHVAFLKFHNAVVDHVIATEPELTTDAERFARARQLVRWHYQAVVVRDFLPTICRPDVVAAVLAGQDLVFNPSAGHVFMPLEYSVAAFRFGHSMVRGAYDHNENFGDGPGVPNNSPVARFAQLFQFTGNGDMRGAPTLPSNWPIRWERFTDPASAFPIRFARRIDTHLAPPLTDLSNEGRDPALSRRMQRILQRLAVRNLLRGYRLAIPTGQRVAAALGVAPLSSAQLLSGRAETHDALIDGGFVDDTPLWFYVLKEAEIQEQGNRLGAVGSRIVAETIIGQLRADPDSFLNREGGPWTPAEGVAVNGTPVATIRGLLQFAGAHP